MCGIAGLIGPADSANARRIELMLDRLHHRGPDDRGSWCGRAGESAVTLGAVRLSILDLSGAAHQPMVDGPSGCVIVYNGEVYNFAELREELARLGETFSSVGDTEVVLRAYLRWGPSVVTRLRGMFAFAVYDPQARRLLVARDPLGIKPLYVAQASGGRFAFASEVRSLFAVPWVRRSLDPIGLMGYLAYGSLQDPYTIVSGVRSLPAGHVLEFDLRGPRPESREPRPFFALGELVSQRRRLDREEAVAVVRSALAKSVRAHTVSDVPIGVFLSGGIDSSSVVALMAEATSASVRTLTVAFDESGFDESDVARAVARRYGTEHSEVRLSPQEFLRDVPRWLASIDQPSADGANTWVISQACVKSGTKVAMSGLGADELFGGYSTFRRVALASRVGAVVRRLPRFGQRQVSAMLKGAGGDWRPMLKAAEWIDGGGSALAAYLALRRMFLTEEARNMLPGGVFDWIGRDGIGCGETEELQRCAAAADVPTAVSLLELRTYMRNTLLRDTDQASMAHSVEVRVPFVDRDLIEAALSIPSSIRLGGRGPKPLLCSALGGALERAWINRRKMTFSLPFDAWIRGPLRREVGSSLAALDRPPFRPGAVRALWERFQRGSSVIDGSRIVSLWVLADWLTRYQLDPAP